ncbi:hypothetical protein ACWGLK_31565 [Streptomyces albidoflavus]|uniref:hypothetical protein n=1 Tax=Streptomyces sp. NPDC056144 TaxID=3345726 RepID=UPI0035E3605C
MSTKTKSPQELLRDVETALRQFNHQSFDAGEDWENPSDTYSALATLSRVVHMLPQAITQATFPTEAVHRAGRLRIDGGGDPEQAINNMRTALAYAVQACDGVQTALDVTWSTTTKIGAEYVPDEDGER